jgi:hypothetical protein
LGTRRRVHQHKEVHLNIIILGWRKDEELSFTYTANLDLRSQGASEPSLHLPGNKHSYCMDGIVVMLGLDVCQASNASVVASTPSAKDELLCSVV